MRPILVLGTGRSGTSSVARILHDGLGVTMMRTPVVWDQSGRRRHPSENIEDVAIVDAVGRCFANDIDESECAEIIESHLRRNDDPWGFKSTQLCRLHPRIMHFLRPRRIIVCMRDRGQTIRSMAEWAGANPNFETPVVLYNKRMQGLTRMLHRRAALWLDFSEQRESRELYEAIKDYIR